MKRTSSKIKLMFFSMMMFIVLYVPEVFAGINLNINKFKPDNNGAKGATELASMAGIILGIIQAIGTVVSVVVLIMIGMKYMLGSVEEKSEYKETMKPYIIGCALLFSISNIVGIIYNFAVNM